MSIKENIKPIFWGHIRWLDIFSTLSVYPSNPSKEIISAIQNKFKIMEYDLPCDACRHSYSKFNKEKDTNIYDDDNFKSPDKLIKLVWNLRNKVNNKLGLEYNITLDYFKIKLNLMSCNNFKKDGIVWTMSEAPFIQKDYIDKVLLYLNDKQEYIVDYNKNYTKDLLKIMNTFIINVKENDFDLDNKYFKIWYKRNKKCLSLKTKIFRNMSCGNYEFIESFKLDKILFIKLFYLGCSIIPLEDMKHLFT